MVVANEIRKLADGSKQAVDQIQSVTQKVVQSVTNLTANAEELKRVREPQEDSLFSFYSLGLPSACNFSCSATCISLKICRAVFTFRTVIC